MDPVGYDYEWLSPPDEDLLCCICTFVCRDAVETECEHLFCQSCLDKWFTTSRTTNCPIDRNQLITKEIRPSGFARKKIQSIRIKCPNQCQFNAPIIGSEYNSDSSPYIYNCELRHIQDHLKSECPVALVTAQTVRYATSLTSSPPVNSSSSSSSSSSSHSPSVSALSPSLPPSITSLCSLSITHLLSLIDALSLSRGLFSGLEKSEVAKLIYEKVSERHNELELSKQERYRYWSVKELKQEAVERNIDISHCLEKEEIIRVVFERDEKEGGQGRGKDGVGNRGEGGASARRRREEAKVAPEISGLHGSEGPGTGVGSQLRRNNSVHPSPLSSHSSSAGSAVAAAPSQSNWNFPSGTGFVLSAALILFLNFRKPNPAALSTSASAASMSYLRSYWI